MSNLSETNETPILSLVSLLKKNVYDKDGKTLGRIVDAIFSYMPGGYPELDSILVRSGKYGVRIKLSQLSEIDNSASVNLISGVVERDMPESGEIYIKRDILGCRLLDLKRQALVRVYDVHIEKKQNSWLLSGLDVHKHGWFHFGSHEHHPVRDWNEFMLLKVLPNASNSTGGPNRAHSLKPAKLADLLEQASPHEQHLLLSQLHSNPALEANVFEEIGDEGQLRLFKSLTDKEVADILARMRADDASDAVMDLPQARRRPVLNLLPEPQSRKIQALLGYNEATAGGLMGTDFIALSELKTVEDALSEIRNSITQQPEALTSVYSIRLDGTLGGVLGIIRALQIDPNTLLRDAVDNDLIFAMPEDDIIAITTRMSDFNLLNLPVLDRSGALIGIVTVDDALEAAIPSDWFQRRSPLPLRQI